MPHLINSNGYSSLIERLNRFPQGAPPSELLAKILALLFTDKEAELVSRLPIRPFTAGMAAQLWGMREVEAFRMLEGLADRALMLDSVQQDGEKIYVLPPPIAGFFDFSLMRARPDIDQKALSELLYQYLNMEEDFVRSLFIEGKTRLGRIMVGEDEIAPANVTRVLNYERASEVIKGAWKIGVGTCYCRQKMHHVGRACAASMEMCMTFNTVADPLIRHGHAREIDRVECLDLLQQAREQNLLQFAENAQGGVSFICNCCGCCCEAMIAARKFSNLKPVHTSNFVAGLRLDLCSGCGRCIDACPVEAVSLVSANDAQHHWMRKCVQDSERCLGCGICARVCRSGALFLVPRAERVITPVDGAHRVVLMAIERDKLQHLIWDNQALFSHRAMAAILGVILRLPPVKQALASSQLGSRYLHAMIQRKADIAVRPIIQRY
ncbi:MAG: (Fe-S)-binding protein [Geobacteraceae bacterium GWC2_58_44]|nr:MAG: (Fe-S)-binding protein [Geobacteraceae bacterium GWC2_58_44]HBG06940.1 (Fe-S)-binding protein [Geobacter sp.]